MTAPRLLAITPGDCGVTDRLPWIRAMARAGLRDVLIREPDLDADALDALVLNLWGTLPGIAVHDRNPRARAFGAPIHLAADGSPDGYGAGWSRSCHDAASVDRALAEGASWVTLSPVFPPTSKPADTRPTLGVRGFLSIAAGRPVLALGGIDADRARELIAGGAAGVAVCGLLFGAPTPEEAARRCAELVRAVH